MRKLAVTIFSCIIWASWQSVYAEVNAQPPQAETTTLSLLFVQSAESAILKALPKKPGYYTLTLYNVPPYITYFSERPTRVTNVASVQNFIKAWDVGKNNFKTNNPNAVLCAAEINAMPNQNQKFYLMTLSSPIYSQNRSILRYVVTPLSKDGFLFKQINFKYVNLIIDNGRI